MAAAQDVLTTCITVSFYKTGHGDALNEISLEGDINYEQRKNGDQYTGLKDKRDIEEGAGRRV